MATLITPEDRAELAKDIQKRVDELTYPELATLSNEAKNEELQKIEQQIENYLIEYTLMEKKVEVATKGLVLNPNMNKNLQMYILYKTFLTTNLTQLLQDGYILIETLRYAFTGTEIIYQIGMEYSVKGAGRQLINKRISLAELLSYAKPEIQWRSTGMGAFKLRAASTKSDFDVEYAKQKAALNEQLNGLHSLFPKINEILTASHGKKQNQGNVYEVYRRLRYEGWADHPPGPEDPQKLDAETVANRYMEIKQGTQSFVTGGDIGLEQDKLLSAAPSIATLNTIGRALKLILTYLKETEKADIKIEHIKNNVFSDEFDNLSKQGIGELLSAINEELQLKTENI